MCLTFQIPSKLNDSLNTFRTQAQNSNYVNIQHSLNCNFQMQFHNRLQHRPLQQHSDNLHIRRFILI